MKTILLIIALAVGVMAATYYVSHDGTATWAQAASIDTPCSTQVAFDSAKAGDTVLFRGGTYNTPQKNFGSTYTGYYNPRNSGTEGNPIVFKSYPGESVVFNGTIGGTGDTEVFATIFGTGNKDWIVFDGFIFQANDGVKQARIMLGGSFPGSRHIVLKNCIVDGGTDSLPGDWTANADLLLLHYLSNSLIQNCLFKNHHSAEQQTYQHSCSKMYYCNNIVFENCEYRDNGTAMYSKRQNNNITVRNCFIHGGGYGIWVSPTNNSDTMNIYNNLIVNTRRVGIAWWRTSDEHGDYYNVYNNTLYNCSYTGVDQQAILVGSATPGKGTNIFNNIIYTVSATNSISFWSHTSRTESEGYGFNLASCDHNLYYGVFRLNVHRGNPALEANYTILASWKTSGVLEQPFDAGCGLSSDPGCGSLVSDPQFVNTSGTLSHLEDFYLSEESPCIGAGRGGADIGADIATVGLGVTTSSLFDTMGLVITYNVVGNKVPVKAKPGKSIMIRAYTPAGALVDSLVVAPGATDSLTITRTGIYLIERTSRK